MDLIHRFAQILPRLDDGQLKTGNFRGHSFELMVLLVHLLHDLIIFHV